MFGSFVSLLLPTLVTVTLAAPSAPVEGRAGEVHRVTLVNRCGKGKAVFRTSAGGGGVGTTTLHGPAMSGIAWLDGFPGPAGTCGDNSLNCGFVEFSLTNSQGGMQNAVNYSLLDGPGLGNHVFAYPMAIDYVGGGPICKKTNVPHCASGSNCPGAFFGSATEGGSPAVCLGDNADLVITFC